MGLEKELGQNRKLGVEEIWFLSYEKQENRHQSDQLNEQLLCVSTVLASG